MSRVISFRDLRLVNPLMNFNEIELLHPAFDAYINGVLEQLGFDTTVGVLYVPNKHRDLQGKVAVGFRAVGQINPYSAYIDSSLCTLVERLVAASKKDMSLAKEMAAMMGNSVNIMVQDGVEYEPDEEFPAELIESDYDDVAAQIAALEAIRDAIRGPSHNDYGNIKTPDEYQNAD